MFFKFPEILDVKKCGPQQRKIIRKLKSNACFFIAFGLIASGVFFYVWPRVMLLTLNYDYSKLREKESNLTHLNRMLTLELASIKSLERVEKIAAEKMGLTEPEDKNIILVKVKN